MFQILFLVPFDGGVPFLKKAFADRNMIFLFTA